MSFLGDSSHATTRLNHLAQSRQVSLGVVVFAGCMEVKVVRSGSLNRASLQFNAQSPNHFHHRFVAWF